MVDGVVKQYEISRTWDVIEDILKSNLSDPLTGQEKRADTSHWIFKGNPRRNEMGKAPPRGWRWPIVIIEDPVPDSENKTVDASKQQIETTVVIKCEAETRSSNDVNGRREAIELAESVTHILTTTGKSELIKAALHLISTSSSPIIPDFIGSRKYYVKTTEFSFRRLD